MKLLPFRKSTECSLGVELEFQIINPKTFAHISRAKDLIRNIHERSFQARIKPEITQSMIEINSSVHTSTDALMNELIELKVFLTELGNELNIAYCGGGTHPTQRWSTEKIYPTKRFKNLVAKYRYLSKRSTVFGQHIHVGCSSADDAIYLTHALARYVPQLIAIAASSPFYQSVDTGFASCRTTVFNAFPLSGVIPHLINWEDFSKYFYMMQQLQIIKTMKDFYWDVRPKPEFGTVEIRVCDTPLTMKKAAIIGAYIQTLALYLLKERPININSKNLYYLYATNRFEASRYAFDGEFINADTQEKCTIQDDILNTLLKVEKYAHQLNNTSYLLHLAEDVNNKYNDATLLRQVFKATESLPSVVDAQCEQWLSEVTK